VTGHRGALYAAGDGVATITLDRPPANALSTELLHEVDALVSRDEAAGDVGCLVITGAGERFFCAGADVHEAAATPVDRVAVRTNLGQQLARRLERLPFPVLAAVNGACLGGGCELALAADIRICADHARFAQPEVRLGIIPGFGGTQRLPRLIGRGRAMELLLTGAEIDAHEAHRIGLVNRVVAASELAESAAELAARLATQPRESARTIKRAVDAGLDLPLDGGLAGERAAAVAIRATDDAQEGMRAFVEKRRPRYADNERSSSCG
jgi:enoyl-CoA hydratase